jgi:acetyl/propionyl-CoA carboxylase alpha subunit
MLTIMIIVAMNRYGEAIALSGRDCSVQRRHQKIIEEGPPLAPKPEVWAEMQAAAVRLAKEVSYINAGTVEYLFMPDGSFAFLELNPRLQVRRTRRRRRREGGSLAKLGLGQSRCWL